MRFGLYSLQGIEMGWRPNLEDSNAADVNVIFFHDRESYNYTMEAINLRIAPCVENGHEPSAKGVWREWGVRSG